MMFNSYNENTLKLNQNLCNGCRTCVQVCPHAVYEMKDKKAEMVRSENCMECGACQLNCEQNAIEVESGVGCAAAMIWAALRGKKEATCGPECC
jgi:NAD-dependent dihydropyrimidine dehydrogenase PreA subunit